MTQMEFGSYGLTMVCIRVDVEITQSLRVTVKYVEENYMGDF